MLFYFPYIFSALFLLQSGKKVASDPSPFVQFTVGHKSFDSKVRPQESDCLFEPLLFKKVNFVIYSSIIKKINF